MRNFRSENETEICDEKIRVMCVQFGWKKQQHPTDLGQSWSKWSDKYIWEFCF